MAPVSLLVTGYDVALSGGMPDASALWCRLKDRFLSSFYWWGPGTVLSPGLVLQMLLLLGITLVVLYIWKRHHSRNVRLSASAMTDSSNSSEQSATADEARRWDECLDLLRSVLIPFHIQPLKQKTMSLTSDLQATREQLSITSANLLEATAEVQQKQVIINSLREALKGKNSVIRNINDLMNQYGPPAVQTFLDFLGAPA